MNNVVFRWPEGIEPKVPVDPPEGHVIPIDAEVYDMVMVTAGYLAAMASFSTRAHEAMLSMASAIPVTIENADQHAVRSGGVEPIVVTLSVVSAAQHAIGIMNELMDMSEGVN